MKEKTKYILEKYWSQIILFVLVLIMCLFISISIFKNKNVEIPDNEVKTLNVVNLSYQSGQIIQKQVYNANDIEINVGTGIYFLGFVSLPGGDNPNVIDWAHFIYNYDSNMTLLITSERPGLYYYLPYLDYISPKPISTVIVKYNSVNIIFMDDTVIEFWGTSEEMQQMQLVYSDLSQDYDDGYYNGYYNGLRNGENKGYENGQNDFGYNDNGTIIPGQSAYDKGYFDATQDSGELKADIINFIPGVLGSIFMFFFQIGQIGILGITILDILGILVLISGLIFLIKFFF